MREDTLDAALSTMNRSRYGNMAVIFTESGYNARRFRSLAEAGMIGVNVGIPAPVASLPFGGMRESLFADIKGQGRAVIDFFTDQKIVTERYWPEQ